MNIYKPEQKKAEFSVARLHKDGKTYEVIVDCEKALQVKEGKADVSDALLVEKIFKDARKGDVQGNLKEAFGTDNVLEIAKEIILKGEIQLTEEYRHKVLEEKKNKIISIITSKASDPVTHYPIPRQRIELGMEKAGFKVNFEKSINEQVKELMENLKKVMPITFNEIIVTINSPVQFSGQTYSLAKGSGEIIEQNYLPDGSLLLKVKLAPGRLKELSDRLEELSHGQIKIKEE